MKHLPKMVQFCETTHIYCKKLLQNVTKRYIIYMYNDNYAHIAVRLHYANLLYVIKHFSIDGKLFAILE